MRSLLLSTAIVVACGAFAAAQAQIVVATAGPMTGQYASFGEQMQRGAEAAVAAINEAGGVLGEQLELVIGDDACDPRQAVAVANDMVSEGVIFMAGHFCSGSSIPASEVYTEEGILMMSPASTNPALTEEGGDNVFRVCGRDDQQGLVAGAYIAANYSDATVAIIHDKTAYGKGLADLTAAALEANGTAEYIYEAYTAGEQDYSALVTLLKNQNADVVYVGGYHTEAGLILRQMRDQGMDAQMISGDALNSLDFWSIAGDAGEGLLFTFAPDPRKLPSAAEVVEAFRAEGYEPEGYTLYTYAAMQIFAQAAEAAGTTDLEPMLEQLHGTTFDTVLGPIAFDDIGDVTEPGYVWYEWSNGNYEEIAVE